MNDQTDAQQTELDNASEKQPSSKGSLDQTNEDTHSEDSEGKIVDKQVETIRADPTPTSIFDIPGKKQVFQALVSGMHISLQSGELYHYLNNNLDNYRTELETLGYQLVHEMDYFYIQDHQEERANDYSRRCLVFVTIMIETISNTGADILETLLSETGFEVDQLPHLSTERYRNYMQNLDIGETKQLRSLLINMHRSGFVEYREIDNFLRFLTPVNRYLQLSLDILEQHNKQNNEVGAETNA